MGTDQARPTERRHTQSRAPIAYSDIRALFNIVRASVALIVVAGSLLVALNGLAFAWPVTVVGLIVLVDALYRRHHGASALPPLLIDVTAIGLAVLSSATAPAARAAALTYVIVAAILLLPLPSAGLVIFYSAVWAVTIGVVGGMGLLDEVLTVEVGNVLDGAAALVFVGATVVLMFAATRSLMQTQDRQREALEVERRAVELKNEFVSMVSHELRTPLTGIAGFTDTLREYWRDLPPKEVNEFLTIMRAETEHLSNLVEDILVIPRLEAGHLHLRLQPLDLAAEVRASAAIAFGDIMAYEVDLPGRIAVNADRVRLRQILRNLLENARKYGGDQVLVEGHEDHPGRFTVVISDNGPGIDPGDRDRIFERFEQLSKGDARLETGVGLGLPIARKLARAMGGDLWHEPRFPVGSKFCFTLELEGGQPGITDEETSKAEPALT